MMRATLIPLLVVVTSLHVLYMHTTELQRWEAMMHNTADDPDEHWNTMVKDILSTSTGNNSQMDSELPKQQHSSPTNETRKAARYPPLSCLAYGGPLDASEMVYWQQIPSDAQYRSPQQENSSESHYLTFEPDEAGFNNIRMGFETAAAMSLAMGRTLVLPPSQGMYLLQQAHGNQSRRFGFTDFFHLEDSLQNRTALRIISFDDFLKREVETRRIQSLDTGETIRPPLNRTEWDGVSRGDANRYLDPWHRTFGVHPQWHPDKCLAAFRRSHDGNGAAKDDIVRLERLLETAKLIPFETRQKMYQNHPVQVDASPLERLQERLAHRTELCIYNETHRNAIVFHLMGDHRSGARMLVHFYGFVFFEDWKQEQWMKRFVRDHLRYADEIQCAAARIVKAMRQKAMEHGQADGAYDSFHIRRGDFQHQFHQTVISPGKIFLNSRDIVPPDNTTVFIASDERRKPFFAVFRHRYNAFLLTDFEHLLEGINTNLYGLIDQLVASRGRTFVGTYLSTFSGYINRLRGYHAQVDKGPGFEKGIIRSYYHVPKEHKMALQEYAPLHPPLWSREFPLGWRDLDKGIDELTGGR